MPTSPSAVSYSDQLQETRQQRRLVNYQRHLKQWDKYEKKVFKHFEDGEILKHGSINDYKKALKARHENNKLASLCASIKIDPN
jgi:hypothetical protein